MPETNNAARKPVSPWRDGITVGLVTAPATMPSGLGDWASDHIVGASGGEWWGPVAGMAARFLAPLVVAGVTAGVNKVRNWAHEKFKGEPKGKVRTILMGDD